MELLQLKYFYKIANSPTLTQAAQELHVSQPSLSGMLRKIESDLGGKLFIRKGRVLVLSERGKILLHHTEEILKELDELDADMDKLNQKPNNRLVIELRAASQLVVPLIKDFQDKYPQAQITIIQNSESQTRNGLAPDISITSDCKKPSGGTLLLREELIVTVPLNHKLANQTDVRIEDLKDERFVFLSKDKGLRSVIDQYCEKMHFKPNVVLESDDLEMIRELIKSGFGLSIIPDISWNNILEGNVKKLHLVSYPCARDIYYTQEESDPPNGLALSFIHELQDAFRKLQE